MAVPDRLVPMVTEVTPVNERVMRLSITHTLGVISLVSVYAPTGVSEFSVEEAFDAQLQIMANSSSKGYTFIDQGGFNTTTGNESRINRYGSGSRDGSSMLLDIAKSRRLRIAGSRSQSPELHRWTWYTNSGGGRREIDHVRVGGRWKLVQNCPVFRRTEFAGTDHKLLQLHSKYGSSFVRCHPTKFGRKSAVSGTRALPMSTNGKLWKVSASLTIPTT